MYCTCTEVGHVIFSHMYPLYSMHDWILVPVVVQEHAVIKMES